MVPCPTCGAAVGPEQCSHGVGECPACGRLFDLAEAAAAPPVEDLVPPGGVTRREVGDAVEIVVRWSSDVPLAGHVVQVLFPLALAGLVVAGLQPTPRGPCAGSPEGLGVVAVLAAVTAYGAVSYLVNRTTFRVTPRGVEVRHGPLPNRARAAVVAPSAARRARVDRVEESAGRGGKQTRYQLEAGGLVTCGWVRPTALEYVAAALRRAYAAPAAPVVGHRAVRAQAEPP